MREKKELKKEELKVSESLGSVQPYVFISHDTRDADLAKEFASLLAAVSAGVLKSFYSSDKRGGQGIPYGVEWYPEIINKLREASDVVVLLTQNSINRPWILYEAGMAKGKLNTPLLGVALGIPLNMANNGPFAQFQNSSDEVDSLTKLIVQLVQRIPNAEPDPQIIKIQVETFKKKVENILPKKAVIDQSIDVELMEDSTIAKLFEEIKIMFQDLPTRIDKKVLGTKENVVKPYHQMLSDIIYVAENLETPSLGFLLLLSYFKEDFPWLYDIGKETYKVLTSSNDTNMVKRAISDFRNVVKITRRPVFFEMYSSKDSMGILEDMRFYLDSYLNKYFEK